MAGHTKVLEMVKEHIEEVNVSISEDKMLAGCQVHRFIVLHKELDADDGELTRTRKVRRKIIGEKFCNYITCLFTTISAILSIIIFYYVWRINK